MKAMPLTLFVPFAIRALFDGVVRSGAYSSFRPDWSTLIRDHWCLYFACFTLYLQCERSSTAITRMACAHGGGEECAFDLCFRLFEEFVGCGFLACVDRDAAGSHRWLRANVFPYFRVFPKFAEKLGVMVDSPEQGFSEGEPDITMRTSLVEQLARPVRAFSTPAPRGGCLENTGKTGFSAADV